jgi:hypothetical protein
MFLAWFEIVSIFQDKMQKSSAKFYIFIKSYLLKNN